MVKCDDYNFIVPTLRVGIQGRTLQRPETHRWSGAICIPTQSVGTIKELFKTRFNLTKTEITP